MKKFPMLVFAFGLPLLGFMVLKDGSKTFYKSEANGLSYQITAPEDFVEDEVEEELVEAEPDVVVEEDVVSETVEAADETVPEAVASEPAAEVETPSTEPALAAALTEEEMIAGKKAARACASCHQLERERNAAGPHLVDLGGRVVGSVEGFKYSAALQSLNDAGAVWTAETLEEWLVDPEAFAEGTKMKFKVSDEEKRRLIAGYLANR